jgi:DMSO reductase anchor subunit
VKIFHQAESDKALEKDEHRIMLTLPLMLFIVLIELCVGQFAVMYLLDMRHAVKRSFLILYAFLYLLLAGLTYLFEQGFSSPDLLNTFQLLNHQWTALLSLPVLLFMLLLLPYTFFLLLDKRAGTANDGTKPQAEEQKRPASALFVLRMVSGGLAALAGLSALFVVGMIYSPLGGPGVGSVLVIAGFFAAALALGGVMTAMWLGHWYLVTPAMTEKPLLLSTTLVLIGLLCELFFFLGAGATITPARATVASPTPIVALASPPASSAKPAQAAARIKPADVPTATPLGIGTIGWLRILIGFAFPLALGALTWKLVRDRSFQSATGMLYLIVVCTLAGEILARGLFLTGLY